MATLSLVGAAALALVFTSSGDAMPAASPELAASEGVGTTDTAEPLGHQPQPDEEPGRDRVFYGDEQAADDGTGDDEPGDERGDQDEPAPALIEEVAVEPLEVAEPIALAATGDFGTGLTIRVVGITPVDGEASGPGEVAGPALRIELEVSNGSDDTISLARMQIEVLHGEDLAPAMALAGPDARPFPEELAPGSGATAAVVFGVPIGRREVIQIHVNSTTDAPTIVFEGSAA